MASDWKEVPFNSLGEVNRGRSRHRPRYAEHLYGGPYPFIQTGDIRSSNGRITSHNQTYSEDGLAQSRLWPKDTMCITIAANIAETAILTYPACFPDSVVGFIADENKCDVRFIEYSFRLLKRRLQSEAIGSVQDNINLATLSRLNIKLPPLQEQKAIAHILGTLDDKIELNRQMNETLEAMAQALFKSWFVDFDPVIDNALAAGKPIPDELMDRAEQRQAVLDSGKNNLAIRGLFPNEFEFTEALGWIPKGWEVCRFKKIVKKYIDNRGKTPPLSEFGIPLIEVKHISDDEIKPTLDTTKFVDRNTYDSWFRAHLEPDDIIISTVGTIGRICMVAEGEEFAIAQNLLGFRFNETSALPSFMYYQMDSFRFRHDVDARLVTTVQASIKRKDLETIDLLLPNIKTQKYFEKMVKPLMAQQSSNQNIQLSRIRDTLLPKLLSGELRIPDAERLVDEVL